MNQELENMELLRKQCECKKIYKEINMARKQFKPRVNICRHEDGSLISSKQETLNRWVRHFDKLLNGRKHNECVTFTTTSSNQILKGKTQDTTDAPTTEEIETALKKLKTNKPPVTDDIPTELLKFAGDRLKQWLKRIFSSVWISRLCGLVVRVSGYRYRGLGFDSRRYQIF